MTDKMPIAYVVAWQPPTFYNTYGTIKVLCPHCGKIHNHGEGDGSRGPHCMTPGPSKGDYMVMGTENARLIYELKREKFFNKWGHEKRRKPKTQAPKRTASYGERGRIIIDPKSTSPDLPIPNESFGSKEELR